MFKMLADNIEKLPDSMCLDSNTYICEYEEGENKVEIIVRGYVTVYFKDEVYNRFSDMPQELQELFRNNEAYECNGVVVDENNWYEVFFNNDEDFDVAEIEGYTSKELEDYCKECMDLFVSNRSR